jgi:hypothetical protein
MRLPSEKYAAGSIAPIGYLYEVPEAHRKTSADALFEIADVMTRASAGKTPLNISFCHYALPPSLSPIIFGCSIYLFDDEGNWTNDVSPSSDLRYALITNQSTTLQVEVALSFTLQLVYRRVLTDVMQKTGEVHSLDVATKKTDEQAVEDIADMIRYGRREAAAMVGSRAKESGVSLNVTYKTDPFFNRHELVQRYSKLREIYNRFDQVRDMVDKVVGMSVGGEWQLVGGSTEVASFLQRTMQALNVQQISCQVARDSEVLGNGYLVAAEDIHAPVYCLRPDKAVIEDGSFFRIDDSGNKLPVGGHVSHFKGVEANGMPYGLSTLEPFVQDLVRLDIFQAAGAFGAQLADEQGIPDAMRVWAKDTLDLKARIEGAVEKGIRAKISPVFADYPEKTALYLPGQETM